MTRLKKFAHSVFSGYMVLGANILYSLAAVPLAMRSLSTEQFGLWAVTTQIAAYMALIDMGVSSSMARLLVDHKDDADSESYGSLIKTGWLMLLIQAVLIIPIGWVASLFLGPMLNIPENLKPDFAKLLLWQTGLQAIILATRVFSQILIAHQRQDLANYAQIVSFAGGFVTLAYCLLHGFGVFSMIIGQTAGLILSIGLLGVLCAKLRLFPARGRWGRVSGERFREMFSFSKDVFLMAVGAQFISGSQTIVVTRALGLDAAAVWAVCNQTYNVVCQLVWKPYDTANMPLSEMAARGESRQLFERFRSLTIFTSSWAILGAVMFALCNQSFVHLWTGGRIGWSPYNDLLLGGWLVIRTVLRCHSGFSAINKQIRGMKFIYFAEGLFFLALALAFARAGGFKIIILSSILASLLFSFSYGIWRTAHYFKLPCATVALNWLRPAAKVAVGTIPVAILLWYIAKPMDMRNGLAFKGIIMGTFSALAFWRWGLDIHVRLEIKRRVINFRKNMPFVGQSV